MENKVHGYKVFRPDWTCAPNGNVKQYTCPGKFEEEGNLNICGNGMHFCIVAADCFNYCNFNSSNKVAEVIAYGDVLTRGDKCCTDKLEIVREIPWSEVLQLVNQGKNCTGYCNTGDCNTGNRNTGDCNTGNRNTGNWNTGNRNTGNWNTGDCNTGNWNTGKWNTGDCNTGNCNTGNWNTGNCNTGNCNTGSWNTGDRNTGDWNTGDCNTGDCNTGNWNTGKWNTGDRNTGDWNTGDRNTGDWNTASFNTGCFMTEESAIMLFGKTSDWSYLDWRSSQACCLLNQIPRNVVEWLGSEHMTEEEKSTHPDYETTGGYLKVLEESECAQLWWDALPESEREIVKSLPNFDAEIFKQCTGIAVEKVPPGGASQEAPNKK